MPNGRKTPSEQKTESVFAEGRKGRSPFHPGQPVPVDLFVGRRDQINKIIERGVGQVVHGKPVAMYVQGEYGIGKSSLAAFVQWLAERDPSVHGIYATVGAARTLDDLAAIVLEATVRSGVQKSTSSETVRNWVAKYIGKQELFGLSLKLDALRQDAPTLKTPYGMLSFLSETQKRLQDTGVKGIFLVLDEINGIAGNPDFSHFIKGMVDQNATSGEPVPLLLMVCGVEERRYQMIQSHQPIERIFDIIDIQTMTEPEMAEFFLRAFQSVRMTVEDRAIDTLIHYSAGFPKIMHLVGDAAFWLDRDGVIDNADAVAAVVTAADEFGKKYLDQQVYRELQSSDYKSILRKIGALSPSITSFSKEQVASGLTDTEKGKFNNCLQRLKKLNVIRSGNTRGEYVFNLRMARLYMWLKSSGPLPQIKTAP